MKRLTTNLLMLLLGMLSMQLYAVELNSIYPMKPNDPEAFYFTPENYPIKADGKMDVSDALQAAINQVKKEKNFGILFIPEGKYKISKTIYIPTAIRLIGYGKNRPEFILAKNSPGFQEEEAIREKQNICSGLQEVWLKKVRNRVMQVPVRSIVLCLILTCA